MNELFSKYRCPVCDKAVLNRSINHCLYCGVTLPAEFLFSDEKKSRLDKELKWPTPPKNTNLNQTTERQNIARQLLESTDLNQLEPPTSDDDRSDSTKVMDAIAGGLIGLVASAVMLLLIFKRSTWFQPWMYLLCVIGSTFVCSIGSYIFGSEFLDRIFYFFRRK